MLDYTCLVADCPKKQKTRGWCSAHYERWRRNGTPGPAGDARRRPPQNCSISDCENKAKIRGWCAKHHWRWKAHGDPIITIRDYGSKRRIRPDGYIDLYIPHHPIARADGYIFEHRMIAWDAGLLTDPEMQVHHVNEIKTDNRIENFEIKSCTAHSLDHVEERGWVINQYGVWDVKPRGERNNSIKTA